MYELYCMYCVFFIPGIRWRHSLRNRSQTMTSLSPDTVRRIEDAAAALIAAGTPNPTNEQVRQHLGGGSLSHISPVMRAFRARQREQATPLPPELAQLLTGQLGLLWQAAVKQAEAGALAAREQADDDIARADKERDEALANVAALESELAVLREVVAERDRLLQEVRELRAEALANVAALESELAVLREVVAERDRLLQEVRELRAEALPLREQVARLTATGEHLAAQLQDTKAELKEAREDGRQLQTELLALARQDGKVKK
ncbi:TPA: hypothetical protein IR779_004610 [Escherichia coli]|nr:hypothetical protein [Escherichia coli]HAP0780434.1 hypothetical protein [Escherichia coli]